METGAHHANAPKRESRTAVLIPSEPKRLYSKSSTGFSILITIAFSHPSGIFVDQLQARAILYLKAEIVRARSFGKPQLYKFWSFVVDEVTEPVWRNGKERAALVFLTTDYGLLDGSGYRDRRKFRIEPGGRVALLRVHSFDGSVIEARDSSRLAAGVYRSVNWPG